MTTTAWTLTVPACEWLTANTRLRSLHLAAEVRRWRQSVYVACQAAKLPTDITPVRIQAVAHYVGRPPVRDRGNLAPTIKAIVDGLGPPRTFMRNGGPIRTVGYGFLIEDSDWHVLGIEWTLRPTFNRARVELTLVHEPEMVSHG